MPRSWLSDESFLSIIISWVPAPGITHLTLLLSPLITIRTDNEGQLYVADTSHGSSDEAETDSDEAETDSDSFTLVRFSIGPGPRVGFGRNSTAHAVLVR
jgi:hypothetical protein